MRACGGAGEGTRRVMGNRVSGWIGLGFGSGRDKEARLGLVGRPVRRAGGAFGPAWGG